MAHPHCAERTCLPRPVIGAPWEALEVEAGQEADSIAVGAPDDRRHIVGIALAPQGLADLRRRVHGTGDELGGQQCRFAPRSGRIQDA